MPPPVVLVLPLPPFTFTPLSLPILLFVFLCVFANYHRPPSSSSPLTNCNSQLSSTVQARTCVYVCGSTHLCIVPSPMQRIDGATVCVCDCTKLPTFFAVVAPLKSVCVSYVFPLCLLAVCFCHCPVNC